MTHAELIKRADELLALRSKATPGPWRSLPSENMILSIDNQLIAQARSGWDCDSNKIPQRDANAAFIAAAHQMADLIEQFRDALLESGLSKQEKSK